MTEELYENNHLTKEELETLAHETAKAVNLECRKLDRLFKNVKGVRKWAIGYLKQMNM